MFQNSMTRKRFLLNLNQAYRNMQCGAHISDLPDDVQDYVADELYDEDITTYDYDYFSKLAEGLALRNAKDVVAEFKEG